MFEVKDSETIQETISNGQKKLAENPNDTRRDELLNYLSSIVKELVIMNTKKVL